jgi:predicted Na+-dependent transporter
VDLLIKLLVQILVPLLVGKALREFVPPVYNFSKKYKVSTNIACGDSGRCSLQ